MAAERQPSHEELMEKLYPSIPWREPATISRTDGPSGYGCRFCIAGRGIKGSEIPNLFQTLGEHAAHIAEAHPPTPGQKERRWRRS